MNIYLNFSSSKLIDSGDLLTFFALLLAYIAYTWSVNRDLESWKSLLLSFKSDLDIYESWLGGDGYTDGSYKDKESFSPAKHIFPLSLESLSEIIRRGLGELQGVSLEFNSHISIFHERVVAFNTALDHITLACSANPAMSERLQEQLKNLGLRESYDDVSYDTYQKNIEKLKQNKDNEELYYLAKNIRRLNWVVHVSLIGNKNTPDKLHYLFTEIRRELDDIIINFDRRKPSFIWYKPAILVISTMAFLVIEYFLN